MCILIATTDNPCARKISTVAPQKLLIFPLNVAAKSSAVVVAILIELGFQLVQRKFYSKEDVIVAMIGYFAGCLFYRIGRSV